MPRQSLERPRGRHLEVTQVQADSTTPPKGDLSPEAARPHLTAMFGHYCFRCGLQPSDERPRMDVDHIIPVARGGTNTFGNYAYLCGPCNSWKGTRIIDYRPGEPREIEVDLPIIPNEERVRKVPIKLVPPVPPPPPEIIKVQVPILVPLPPTPHDCYGALPRLFSEYKTSTDQVARLSEKIGRAETESSTYRIRWETHKCDIPPFGCFAVPVVLFLVAAILAVYFYIY